MTRAPAFAGAVSPAFSGTVTPAFGALGLVVGAIVLFPFPKFAGLKPVWPLLVRLVRLLKSDAACAFSLSAPVTFAVGAAVFNPCPNTRTRVVLGFWAAGLGVGGLFVATDLAWPKVAVARTATRKKAEIPRLFMNVVTLFRASFGGDVAGAFSSVAPWASALLEVNIQKGGFCRRKFAEGISRWLTTVWLSSLSGRGQAAWRKEFGPEFREAFAHEVLDFVSRVAAETFLNYRPRVA